MNIILGAQQQFAHDDLINWRNLANEQIYELSGLAGTGKTTIIKYFIETMGIPYNKIIFCSFMGKAVQRMNATGIPAKTIHSIFFTTEMVPIMDMYGKPVMQHGRPKMKPVFQPIDELPKGIELIVIDEGGTVGERLAKTVLKHGIPTIILGDINQLPPVMDKQFFLTNPNYHLTEIMRQAEGDPIILLSRLALAGKEIPLGTFGKCDVANFNNVLNRRLMNADTVLASTNRTRERINHLMRTGIKKFDEEFICRGDKLICRQNNWDLSINHGETFMVNGLVGYVRDFDLKTYNGSKISMDFRPEFLDNDIFTGIEVDMNYFRASTAERKDFGRTNYNKFEPGDCITVHLSQGSEYDDVVLFEEDFGSSEFKKKLLYTGITRAKKSLTIIKKPPGGFYNYNWDVRYGGYGYDQ